MPPVDLYISKPYKGPTDLSYRSVGTYLASSCMSCLHALLIHVLIQESVAIGQALYRCLYYRCSSSWQL